MSTYPKSLTIGLKADTRDSDQKLRDTEGKVLKLTDRLWSVKLDADDKEGLLKLKTFETELDKLSRKVSRPHVSIDGIEKADLQLDRLDLKLDRINEKTSGNGGLFSNVLKGLFSSKGFNPNNLASGEAAESAEFGLSALASPGGLGIVSLLSSFLPGILGLGIGGLAGAGGAFGALSLDKSASKQGSSLLAGLEKDLLGSLTAQGSTGTRDSIGNRVGGAIPTMSFVTGLDGIMKQIGQDAKTLGPDLAGMFRASLPFLSAFTSMMEQAAKVMLPAFTQSMHQMVSSGALKEMTQGLVILITDLARFITAMGPALKPSADIFRDTMMILGTGIDGLGHLIAAFAQAWDIVFKTSEMTWKVFFDLITGGNIKGVENAFDEWRHDTASILVTMGADFGSFQHDISHIFDDIRHDVSATWSAMWRDVFGALQSGVRQDINFVKVDLLDALVSDVRWLGGQFMSLGKAAISDLWSGLKSGASSITSWLSGFAHGVIGVLKKVFGIFSPSRAFYSIGQNLMHGLSQGIQSKANTVSGALGNVSGNVKRWASTVQEALKLNNLPLSLTAQVLHQISTESGGNPMAINLSDINAQHGDPSRGLLQTIGTTFAEYHVAGTSWDIYNPLANVAAAIDYAKHVYGPTLMRDGMGLGSGRGYALGGWITEPIAGVGLRSGSGYSFGELGPEYVSPAGKYGGGHGGDTYIITCHKLLPIPKRSHAKPFKQFDVTNSITVTNRLESADLHFLAVMTAG